MPNRCVSVRGEGCVASYRMYSVDGAGHIRSFAEEIIAENDEEAISKAREMKADALQCEVWEGTRLVAALRRQDLAG
jgi:hypothetical protein